MSVIKELEQAVLALPMEQRVRLTESLLESLTPGDTTWSEAEDLAEVERRELQIKNGEVQPVSESEFWKRVEARRQQ
jgi:putative addiction module component (TIGR02574 family)